VDGGQHRQRAGYDENRTQELRAAGFRVLRFWNNEVLREIESVKERIWLVVRGLQSHPPPDLPLEGGGDRKAAPP
jgi:adenine-specific DNA-methyltransferase